MKKNLCIFIITVLFLMCFAGTVGAVNDASDLGYKLKITVTDKDGIVANTFQLGDSIHVKLSLVYTGTGAAPIYGLQGKLHFDPYIIRSMSVTEKNGVRMQEKDGQITYAFLDMTGQGQKDSMMANIGEVKFTAKSNGIINMYCDDFIVTNKDASHRYIDLSAIENLVIGTGVKDVTMGLLIADIIAAEKNLADCTVTDNPYPIIFYPDFWITTKTEGIFKLAIQKAKLVSGKSDATKKEIETAVAELNAAVKVFEQSKIIASRRWNNNEYVDVRASVKGKNGKIHTDFTSQGCRLNTSCTIRVIPDEGYETEYIYVNGKRFLGNDIFTIPMVTRDTKIEATFCKKPPFTDIAHSDWFYVGVRYAYNHDIFKGTSQTEFSPGLEMNRAMLVTVMYRMEGQPKVDLTAAFEDVENDNWYSEAIMWASQNNIVKGYGNGMFGTKDSVTREQIAVMLYRYYTSKGNSHNGNFAQLNYLDAAEISDYAIEAMQWAVGEGLIKGNTETTLNPKGKATRAEGAEIMMRYIELIERNDNTEQ